LKIFVEYKIRKELRHTYISSINKLLKMNSNLEVFEGTDQKELFVEIWNNYSHQQYLIMKQERTNNIPQWNEINSCIEGGSEKIHIWHFTKLKMEA